MKGTAVLVLALCLCALPMASESFHGGLPGGRLWQCAPTPSDLQGPFYRPGAPVRSKAGEGFVLSGTVKSAADCSAIAGALLEFWQAGPDGRYDDAHRAAVFSDGSGAYRFETDFPGAYYGRPPHIHILVTAAGFRTLVTQHYPEEDSTEASFDLVLVPEP